MAHFDMTQPVVALFGHAKKASAKRKPKPDIKSRPTAQFNKSQLMQGTDVQMPTHEERMHNAAADEHVHAARRFVAGDISHKQFQETKRRAESIMGKTPKNKKYS